MTNAVGQKRNPRPSSAKNKAEKDPALEYARIFPYLAGMKFLADSSGDRTAVVIPMEGFRRLMSDYQSIAIAFNAREEDFMSEEEFLAALKEDGLLPPEA